MRLLDLFCGAGGAAMGYHRAGFEVVGVDSKPQPHYPFEFHQADALEYPLGGFDAIHASPPCQRYSMYSRNLGTADKFPDLVAPMRARLEAAGKPYVIENVIGSPLRSPVLLCGTMFGLNLLRHRLFEVRPQIATMLPRCHHKGCEIPVYGNGTPQWHRERFGRNVKVSEQREAMGIDWTTRDELVQAIPPAYTEFIGRRLCE